MKKKIVLLVSIILVLFFASSYLFKNPAKELNENDFDIISIRDGETGESYLLSDEQENDIVQLFNNTKFSKKFDILPRGGWSYWIEISIKGEETKVMITNWMEYEGKKYSPNIRGEIKKILSEKETITKDAFLNIDASEIKEITIRTQMTEQYPEVKVILDSNEIENLIEYLNGIKGQEVELIDETGWQFWLLFEGYDILVQGEKLRVNASDYKMDSSIKQDLLEFYMDAIEEGQKYP